MTKTKFYNLPLKYDPAANHLLSWSIRDEIIRKRHTFESFTEMLLNGVSEEVRKYAEVLYHTIYEEKRLLLTIGEALEKIVVKDAERAKVIAYQFRDWGFSVNGKGVSQDIKAKERK